MKTSNKITIKQVEKIISISIKYVKITYYGLILAKMW